MDGSPKLEVKDTKIFQESIGVIIWATDMGQNDLLYEVLLLPQYQSCPREGHLGQLLHIFSYMNKKPKITLNFDTVLPNI